MQMLMSLLVIKKIKIPLKNAILAHIRLSPYYLLIISYSF